MGEIADIHQFRGAKQLAAFAGVSPLFMASSSVRGMTRLAQTGNPRLRKALFYPALVANVHNPSARRICSHLESAGKRTWWSWAL